MRLPICFLLFFFLLLAFVLPQLFAVENKRKTSSRNMTASNSQKMKRFISFKMPTRIGALRHKIWRKFTKAAWKRRASKIIRGLLRLGAAGNKKEKPASESMALDLIRWECNSKLSTLEGDVAKLNLGGAEEAKEKLKEATEAICEMRNLLSKLETEEQLRVFRDLISLFNMQKLPTKNWRKLEENKENDGASAGKEQGQKHGEAIEDLGNLPASMSDDDSDSERKPLLEKTID